MAKRHQQADRGRRCRAASSTRTCRSTSSNVAIVCQEASRPASATASTRRQQGPRSAASAGGTSDGRRRHHARRPALQAALRRRGPRPAAGELGLGNVMQVPRLEKIVVNMGVGRRHAAAVAARGRGRRPHDHHRPEAARHQAKKSIAGFKLREGNAIGAKVTLRGDRMWEFFDRLISLAIPRIRDFRGLPPNSSTAAATTRSASPSS